MKVVGEKGFTVIEILVSSVVIGIMALSVLGAYVALNSTAVFAHRKVIGTQLATNQLEYLKSLPYDNLAVAGGAIPHSSPLPNSETVVVDNVSYEIRTSINYVDDAFDGCASYPTPAIKNILCRNLPEPTGATTDTNPADYKIVNVKAYVLNRKVAELDTNISARVAETGSTTGAMTVTVIDTSGAPVAGATVNVKNTTVTPNININDNTDTNGVAIFYGLPPDSGNDYLIAASKSGYSSHATIAASGSLTPTYPNQKIIAQQSSSVTLIINPKGQYSLVGEVTNTSGAPISNMRLYAKGGHKKYTSVTNTAYYFDNLSPADTRPTTDGSGNFVLESLDPGSYIFCGDAGATSCTVGGTTYYLIAAIPYSGEDQIGRAIIPAATPTTTFSYNGHSYYQKMRFIFSTSSSYPRIHRIVDGSASKASGTHTFKIEGANLPCNATNPGLCGTTVTVKNSAGNIPASCIGSSSVLTCTIDVSGANTEQSNITLTASGNTIDIPNGTGLQGGVKIEP